MSSTVLDLLSGYFSEELLEERPIMRSSLYNGGPAGVEAIKAQFRSLLSNRNMTHDGFYRATMACFPDDDRLYAELTNAYRFFFDEEPPTVESLERISLIRGAEVSPSRMKMMKAVDDHTYEVVFDGSVEPSTILCTVEMSGLVPGVSVRPDPFMSGSHGDPRPVMAAVIAMHRARQVGGPGPASTRDDGLPS